MIEKTPFLRALFPQLDTSRQEKYTLSLPRGAKKIIRDFALEHGYASFNDFVKHAIWEQIERDSEENPDDSEEDSSGLSK